MHVVRNFMEIFLEELLGIPPDRAIAFEIELMPTMTPISKALYRLALVELKELQMQL